MKTLLIYPKFPDTFWSFKYALSFIRKRAAFPPLGLLTVAGMLPGDWQLKLMQAQFRRQTRHPRAETDFRQTTLQRHLTALETRGDVEQARDPGRDQRHDRGQGQADEGLHQPLEAGAPGQGAFLIQMT